MSDAVYEFSGAVRHAMLNVLARMEGGGDFLGPKPWTYKGPPMTKAEFDRRPNKKSPSLFSGYTLGKFQGDAAAGNPHARDAFYDVMGQALNAGKVRPERYQEILSGMARMASLQNPIHRHRHFIDSLLASEAGRERVALMDEAILQDDQNKVGKLEQAFEKRWGRSLAPISLAMLASWANKFGDLDRTEGALTGERAGMTVGDATQSPRTGDILDYLAGQKFFRGAKGEERYRNHLEALTAGLAETVRVGQIQPGEILSADAEALNRRLQEVESEVRLKVAGNRSVGIHNDRDVDGIPDDLQVDHDGYVSPVVRKRADIDVPALRKLAALSEAEFAAATDGPQWERLWRQMNDAAGRPPGN